MLLSLLHLAHWGTASCRSGRQAAGRPAQGPPHHSNSGHHIFQQGQRHYSSLFHHLSPLGGHNHPPAGVTTMDHHLLLPWATASHHLGQQHPITSGQPPSHHQKPPQSPTRCHHSLPSTKGHHPPPPHGPSSLPKGSPCPSNKGFHHPYPQGVAPGL
jgi:hypothetical protein